MGEKKPMRKQNWPIILNEKIEEWKDVPFVWGWSDCLHFAGSVAAAMLDYDPHEKIGAEKYIYESEAGAIEMLNKHFGGKMGNVFNRLFAEVRPKKAGRGDIAIVDFLGKEICGIIDSTGRAVAVKSNDGILFIPVNRIKQAWRVD